MHKRNGPDYISDLFEPRILCYNEGTAITISLNYPIIIMNIITLFFNLQGFTFVESASFLN